MKEEKFINKTKLAKKLGVSYEAVTAMEKRGLPHYKIGAYPKYKLSEVLEWAKKDVKDSVQGS